MITHVLTRDRRTVPFELPRITADIQDAMVECAQGDRCLAEELADAVLHFLEDFHASPVEVDTIQDMVEKVLMETGHREIARSYVLLRERRARIRELIRVRDAAPPGASAASDGAAGDGVTVEGRGFAVSQPWDRSRVAHALVAEADLDLENARAIAAAVEERVVRSGLRTITTSLIRALVDNELLDRGLAGRLDRQSQLGIPKYDLERALFHADAVSAGTGFGVIDDPDQLAAKVGEHLLARYALGEIYSPAVRDAHRTGVIHIHHAEKPTHLLLRRVDAAEVAALDGSRGGAAARSVLADLFRSLGRLRRFVADEIEVTALGEALCRGELESGLDAGEAGRELLSALSELETLRSASPRPLPTIVLAIPFAPLPGAALGEGSLFGGDAPLGEDAAYFLVQTLTHALAEARERGGAARRWFRALRLHCAITPATFESRRFHSALRTFLELVPREVEVAFSIAHARDRHGRGPAGDPSAAVAPTMIAGKFTVNLPRIARTAVGHDGAEFHTGLRSAISCAAEGARNRAEFLRRWFVAHARDSSAEVERAVFAVGLVGLDDALRIGHGVHLHDGPTAFATAREWIALAAEHARREGARCGVRLELEETANRGPLLRLERGDAPRDEAPGAQVRLAESYTSGVRFHARAPLDPLEARQRTRAFAEHVRLLDTLDPCLALRSESSAVLLSFLEEVAAASAAVGARADVRGPT